MNEIGVIFDNTDKEQLLSIPAQRLIEKLSLLKNRKFTALRRWFWELLQNASDYNESVSVKLDIYPNRVDFRHNGEPFSLRDALNLISPDSNKREDKIHKDNIGKFGTGLVSTHILSAVIHTEGICKIEDKGYFHFSVDLNREDFGKKELLIQTINTTKSHLKDSLKEIPYTNDFHTLFSYNLDKTLPSLTPISCHDIDLEYLYNVLPYTLCFMPKIKSVEIKDYRNGEYSYYISIINKINNSIQFKIIKDGCVTEPLFKYFEYNNIASVVPIEDNTILAYPKEVSKIFCGLPLIGTEDIGLPIVINSFGFEPTTEREGVELEPVSNEENRRIMFDSIELYKKILDYVEEKQLKHAYLLTNIRRKYNGTQASNTQFYNQIIIPYKQQILNHSIVPGACGDFVKLSQIKLPINNSKPDDILYTNASFISKELLPIEEEYKGWFEATDFTLFPEQKYNYEDLASAIESIDNLFSTGRNIEDTKNWLKQCILYLKACNKYIFSEKNLLPNQTGTLCLARNLYVDLELPKELKEVYNQLYESEKKKIEDKLLDKEFNDFDVVNCTYKIEDIAKDIDSELQKQFAKLSGNIHSIIKPLNELYSWMSQTEISKEQLKIWFMWYYPKRASLIVDMLTDAQREQALTIAQSGKMEALAKLASSELTSEELNLLVANIKKLPAALGLLGDKVDDRIFADSETGDLGEELVYKDLLQKYPKTKGYTVEWSSRDKNEPCYDFKIIYNGTIICYYDAKTTTRGLSNSDSIPFFLRKSQWKFLNQLPEDKAYYIARVFIGDNGNIQYVRIITN